MTQKVIPIASENPRVDPLQTICDLKWNYPIFGMDRGEFRSCCRTPAWKVSDTELEEKGIDAFLNSDSQIKSRLSLIKGERITECQSCWNLEDQGMTSPRHTSEHFWHHLQRRNHIDKSLKFDESTLRIELDKINSLDHQALRSRHPYMLEIMMGSTCDMKCMYCTHHYSTQWAAERIKYGEITQEQYDSEFPKASGLFRETFWDWFETANKTLARIGIIGGEPLITPEFYEFTERLLASVKSIQHARKNKINFWVVTNMNTPEKYLEKFFAYLPRLTEVFNVEILVSMESVGKRAEYIRNGVDWTRFEKNINRLLAHDQLNFTFGFIMSMNALNITSIKEFIQFAEGLYHIYKKPVHLKHNIISFPDWQSPFILTPDFAEYLDDCVEYMKLKEEIMPIVQDRYSRWDEYIIFLDNLAKNIRENKTDKINQRKKFVEWFKTYDERRKLTMLEIFPEYAQFYKMCENLA
jgi:hypothetical protein